MKNELIQAVTEASGFPKAQIAGLIVRPKEMSHGDYSFPCFTLSKEWKTSPPEAAKKLQAEIKLPDFIEKAETVGPYVNFFIKRDALAQEVIAQHLFRDAAPISKLENTKKNIIIEYSSPNIAKPFHIGHLRTTLIGHSLDRIYRFLGYNVHSINHLGDWGTQFGFVWAGCALWGTPQEGTIFDLVGLYIKASNLKKAQEEGGVPPEDADKANVNEMAREYFKRLEQDEPEAVKFWKWCLDISMKYLKELYERLEVKFDYYTGESFFRDKLKKVEEEVRASGILEDSRGALGVDLGKKFGFVRIFAEDGRSLYITRDLAAADYRYTTYKPDRILHVVGAPQTLYFQQLIGVLNKMKHPAGECLIHVSYGNVPGISTRSAGPSDRIWLHALLEEAHERALEAYRNQVQKRPEGLDEEKVAEAVGLGAITFNYLCRSNIKEFNFSWEEALNFQGDTGPYIQYALARLYSIESKAKEQGIIANKNFDPKLLTENEAYRIVSLLSQFDETVERAAKDFEPYHIALYVLELARAFSGAYKDLRVIGEKPEIATARLSLFMALKKILQQGLILIGVPPVERM